MSNIFYIKDSGHGELFEKTSDTTYRFINPDGSPGYVGYRIDGPKTTFVPLDDNFKPTKNTCMKTYNKFFKTLLIEKTINE